MRAYELERAILEALNYSDIFEYPMRVDELHRYLPVRVELGELLSALRFMNGRVDVKDDFYFLAGRSDIVHVRKSREARSKTLLPHAMRYGKILGALPFVRMAALTGSLAVMNVSKNADFDYMLVVEQGRVWTARLFAMVVNRVANLFGHTLCPNLIVSEAMLEWPLRDLYSARELCQMIPITGGDVYHQVMKANEWATNFLPNADPSEAFEISEVSLQKLFEPPLRGQWGDRLEAWEMNRKIARFSQQDGFGEETIFTADVCQGNFHHHRKWTKEVFEERVSVIARRAKPDEAIPSMAMEIASSLPTGAPRNDGITP